MSEDLMIRHCSPTLAGIKTGSLFTCPYTSRAEVVRDIRDLNRRLAPKGLRVLPLRYRGDRVLIYVFRPKGLKADLSRREALGILREAGYSHLEPMRCVSELIRRLNDSGDFPHEIGLFLSYPPEDVRGFVENRGGGYKCLGYWKVYGDAAAAQRLFERYKRCTDIYCEQWEKGLRVEDLAVAV